MSEGVSSEEAVLHRARDSSRPLTAGTRLKLARESAGLHIGALAVSLKVPVSKLEALENDRVDLLPDAVFARALASSVCRTLKIDPNPILADLPQSKLSRLEPESLSGGDVFRDAGQGTQGVLGQLTSRPFVVIGFVLAVAAAGIAFYPASIKKLPIDLEKPVQGLSIGAAMTDPPPPATPIPSETVATGLTSGNGNPPTPVIVPDAKISTVVPATVVPSTLAPPPTASAPQASSSANSNAAAGILVLKTKGTSWVEVTDAGGVVQLRKTMAEGETIGVSGGLPLAVIVGRADAIEVQVRGKALDLTSMTKDNVARFEVR